MRPALRLALFSAILLVSPLVSARQADPPFQATASYEIQATLDSVNHLILGTERLTWRNTSSRPAAELRFHMYWNAWRDPSSTWMREVSLVDPALSLARRPDGDRGLIDLTTLRLAGDADDADLLAAAHYIAPDDGNAADRTVLAVPLPQAVPPGGTIVLDLAWNAHVPRPYARTGVIGSYFFIGQWFPKIGVLEDTGWNCHQFHASTEFFADFGSYDVSLTTPTGWIVGASGVEQAVVDHGNGTSTHRYHQDRVHDFAWTASPDYVERHEQWHESGLPAVDIRLLLLPEHADQAARHFAAAGAALAEYGRWLGPYPYGHLTIVDPPAEVVPGSQGGGMSGMEYPTLITAGTQWLLPWASSGPEGVVVHETGHQFLYAIVGTNEFEHAWMDEGLNTYVTARVMERAFPHHFDVVGRYFGNVVPWTYTGLPWSRVLDGDRWLGYRQEPGRDVPSSPSWRYLPSAARSVTYNKTALWMHTLERLVGWETMQKILNVYFTEGAFGHPTPDRFFAIASRVSGRDLTWFFDAVYRSASTFDYAVGRVTSRPADNGSTDTTVVVERRAPGIFPIDVRVAFADGSRVDEHWDGAATWKAFTYRRGSAVTAVDVDPDRVLLLDEHPTNNSWRAAARGAEAAGKWSLRWLLWVQHLFLTYAFLA